VLQLLWFATRGYRLRPWQSPYLRWRMETYTGIPAESFTAASFLKVLFAERRSMLKYLLWVHRHAHLLKN
jgi:hypothetical protein